MEWNSPYVIYRLCTNPSQGQKEAQIVFIPHSLQKAKYWLQYIGEPFDVLCVTPAHAKHSKKTDQPEYWSHKERNGKAAYSAADWEKIWSTLGWDQTLSDTRHPSAEEEQQ